MAIPSQIKSGIAALSASFTAISPINAAPRAQVIAIQTQAGQLIADIDLALGNASGALDTFPAVTDPALLANAVSGLAVAASTQADLSDVRGLIGRVNANLQRY
jgi:hypothetical protein